MRTIHRFISRPSRCYYLPDQQAQHEHVLVASITPDEYQGRLDAGWRRFGRTLYRTRCRACSACRSLRVDVRRFRPDRSMRRVSARNREEITIETGPAAGFPDAEVFDLYLRYHRDQQKRLGWPSHEEDDPADFREAFLDNPVPTQQWRYRLDGRLVAVGYVDLLPDAYSAVYCIHDPDLRDRSLGTWNILCIINRAIDDDVPFVHLGYYVAGCRSLNYKARFKPNQIFDQAGRWVDFEG